LRAFREEGIVIIGSGSAVHNLQQLWTFADKPSPKFVMDFDKEMEAIACKLTGEERNEKASGLDQHAAFRKSHPTAEVSNLFDFLYYHNIS
jgi:4,5-DOPA dioxygenase extradiol